MDMIGGLRAKPVLRDGWRDLCFTENTSGVVIVVLASVLFAFTAIQTVRDTAQSARAAHHAVTVIEKETDEMEALAWRAFALRRTPTPEELAEPRADITRELRVLEVNDRDDLEQVATLRKRLDRYRRTLSGEMELVASARHEDARLRHLVLAVPLYENLDAYLDSIAAIEQAEAHSAAVKADLGVTAALSVLALALMALFVSANASRNELARERERRLRDEAVQDALTGLANRRALHADLSDVFTRPEPSVLALIDLDGFKDYNDTFGHGAGDLLLKRIAMHLASIAGRGRAYRLGGDEFCVLTAVEQREALEDGLRALEESGDGFTVRASFGTVSLPDDAADPQDALARADRLMYQEKFRRQAAREPDAFELARSFLAERFPHVGEQWNEVAELAESLGSELGLTDAELDRLRRATILRDVGKVAIPDPVLGKNDSLDNDEAAFMRSHSVIGARLLTACQTLAPLAEIVRATHERWDGTGYPDRLAGTEIPVISRIIFVCDAYSAMTTGRPYRCAVPVETALAEIKSAAGTQFDPDVVAAFERVQRRRESPHKRRAIAAL